MLIVAAVTTPAQSQPLSGPERVEILPYDPSKRQLLRTTAGGAVTVVLSPGEVAQQVILGDTRAFQVTVAPPGERVTVRALRPAADTTMQIRSDQRTYDLIIQVSPDSPAAYSVRFAASLPPQSVMARPLSRPAQISTSASTYRLKGAKALRPTVVREDGVKTYIEWAEDQALPAVFSRNSAGDEETVDSYMRGGVLTIDRVYDRLVFRLGKAWASAERIVPKTRGRQ